MSANSAEIKRYTRPLVVVEWGLFAICVALFALGFFDLWVVTTTGVAAVVSLSLYRNRQGIR
jgi:uncharacterized membrane protein YjjP (DUF1212 family)